VPFDEAEHARPVTIETGQTFEQEAIVKWFRECRDNGRKPMCPLTQRELGTSSTEISLSIALCNVMHKVCTSVFKPRNIS
jgi:hypothetical protein